MAICLFGNVETTRQKLGVFYPTKTRMGDLSPIAFDIETSGLEPGAVVTVAGLTTDIGSWIALNTTGREADASRLVSEVERQSDSNVQLSVFHNEGDLLTGLADFASRIIDDDNHYLTAYNGERWSGGFDLPFVRTACLRQDVAWPFPDGTVETTATPSGTRRRRSSRCLWHICTRQSRISAHRPSRSD